MAAEDVALAVASADHKRKLEDLKEEERIGGEEEEKEEERGEGSPKPDADDVAADAKRPRIDDGLDSENGFEGGKLEEGGDEGTGGVIVETEQVNEGVEALPQDLPVTGDESLGGDLEKDGTQREASVEDLKAKDGEMGSEEELEMGGESKDDDGEKPSEEESKMSPEVDGESGSAGQTTSRKVEVPNDKVGVLIGKGGETIRYLQFNSGAKIQIMRDAEADPHSTARPVEIIGTLSSISKAEKLIFAVIAEADAGGSPSLVARGLPGAQNVIVGDQLELQVPNEKVGLIIGRGGDTIKSLQARSGARIQLIPQHLPEGDGSKERTVRVTGNKRQIETAREMILDVMNQTVRPSHLGGFKQQESYRPRGPAGPSHWGQRSQPTHYDYSQRGAYPSHGSHYPPQSYGGYPQHMPPRGGMGPGWEQRPPSGMQRPFSQSGGYDYYGGRANPAPGPTPGPAMGPVPSPGNYDYGKSHGSDYGHQAPYSQTAHAQQGYGPGHGYDEQKYDTHAATQHPYGQGGSQPGYPQGSYQSGYGAQQQYGKQPSYGMPSQGPVPHTYGAPRANQPGEMPYQGSIQPGQSYGVNVPPQQQYAYASTGPMQQTYPPYGSGDMYSQVPAATSAGYPQHGGQAVQAYGQPGGQPAAGYVQGASGVYGSYQSTQQTYPEQPATSNAAYGFQVNQDPTYAAYATTQSGQQAYSQPAPAQTAPQQAGYDQPVPQPGGYAVAPGSTPA